jgi:hypothetical protein
MHPALTLGGLIAALAANTAAQATIVVSGGGAALQQAVAAAAPGDVLDVQPAVYTPVTCGKGLRVLLQPGAVIQAPSPFGNALTFQAIPAGEVAVLRGGLVHGLACTGCAGSIVVDGANVLGTPGSTVPMPITNCTGPIVFDATSFAVHATANAEGELHATNATQLSFRGCRLPFLRIANSHASVVASAITPIGIHVAGLHLVSGSVAVDGGAISGAFPFSLPIPTAGVRIDGGHLTLTGGTFVERRPWAPPQQHAIEANGGTLRIDPSVTITGSPAIVGTVAIVAQPIPGIDVTHTANTLQATAHGSPGDVLVTFAALPAAPIATPWGDAWLSPSDPILDVALVPPSGTSTFQRTFANVPPFVVLTLQPVALSAAGGLTVGTPVRFAWD